MDEQDKSIVFSLEDFSQINAHSVGKALTSVAINCAIHAVNSDAEIRDQLSFELIKNVRGNVYGLRLHTDARSDNSLLSIFENVHWDTDIPEFDNWIDSGPSPHVFLDKYIAEFDTPIPDQYVNFAKQAVTTLDLDRKINFHRAEMKNIDEAFVLNVTFFKRNSGRMRWTTYNLRVNFGDLVEGKLLGD